jgi:hypothetical protein
MVWLRPGDGLGRHRLLVLLGHRSAFAQSLAGTGCRVGWAEAPGAAFHNLLTVLPPALILAICEVMAYPVVQRVRGLDSPLSGIVVVDDDIGTDDWGHSQLRVTSAQPVRRLLRNSGRGGRTRLCERTTLATSRRLKDSHSPTNETPSSNPPLVSCAILPLLN